MKWLNPVQTVQRDLHTMYHQNLRLRTQWMVQVQAVYSTIQLLHRWRPPWPRRYRRCIWWIPALLMLFRFHCYPILCIQLLFVPRLLCILLGWLLRLLLLRLVRYLNASQYLFTLKINKSFKVWLSLTALICQRFRLCLKFRKWALYLRTVPTASILTGILVINWLAVFVLRVQCTKLHFHSMYALYNKFHFVCYFGSVC